MVRDAFALAKAKAPTIIFIDEIVNINEIERAHSLNSSIKSSKAWFEFS
jgi:ATP-dependent 26S proteasome regulatory subunit